MNAKVTTVKQANFVTGKEAKYVEIANERGRVVIEIGDKNHEKLLKIVGDVPRETAEDKNELQTAVEMGRKMNEDFVNGIGQKVIVTDEKGVHLKKK